MTYLTTKAASCCCNSSSASSATGRYKSFISRSSSSVAFSVTCGLALLCIKYPISTFRTLVGGIQVLVTYKMNLDRVNVGGVILVLGSFSIVLHIALVCL
jgi:hypothetical protein